MKKLLLTLSTIIFLGSCFGQNQRKLLHKAYKKADTIQLAQFFENWQKAVPPLSENETDKLTELQKDTYLAFSAFYRPDSIELMGGSEFGNNIYKNARFLLAQNNINIFSTDTIYNPVEDREAFVIQMINETVKEDSTRENLLRRNEYGRLYEHVLDMFAPRIFMSRYSDREKLGSIADFRPPIEIQGKRVLYLTKKYSKLLHKFLKKKHSRLGTGGLMNPARAKNKSLQRQEFLENYIKIWQGHWGGYWQLHSYPLAESITFDINRTAARVDFRMIYEGGEAILIKENGHWKIVTAYLTWIE